MYSHANVLSCKCPVMKMSSDANIQWCKCVQLSKGFPRWKYLYSLLVFIKSKQTSTLLSPIFSRSLSASPVLCSVKLFKTLLTAVFAVQIILCRFLAFDKVFSKSCVKYWSIKDITIWRGQKWALNESQSCHGNVRCFLHQWGNSQTSNGQGLKVSR